MNHIEHLIEQYKHKAPHIVFEWNDSETDARGWVVINSLRNGAAGGGTRMRAGLTRDEVVALAKVMEIKFSVSGPSIGGAKSGIDFDPNDPRRDEVLQRWYKAVIPLLKTYYGTGGDLNVDELRDVIPITEDLGLWHPQEGVVNGHFRASSGDKVRILGQLRHGVSKIIEDPDFAPPGNQKYAIADMITGFGVAASVWQYYELFHDISIRAKKVIVQGWGNVASAAALYLAQKGAVITGIIDRFGGILHPEGLGYEQVAELFRTKKGNKLHTAEMMPFRRANERIWDMPCDIFIPGAASRLVNGAQIDRLLKGGLEVISCGANVPFVDDEYFFGPTARAVDARISLIPDFIANCGMARAFAFLMQPDIEITDANVFNDVSQTIRRALKEVYTSDNEQVNLSSNALRIALEKLDITSQQAVTL